MWRSLSLTSLTFDLFKILPFEPLTLPENFFWESLYFLADDRLFKNRSIAIKVNTPTNILKVTVETNG